MGVKYQRVTDKKTMGILNHGLHLVPEEYKKVYDRLFELEEMMESGKLKFVEEKKTKKGEEK